MIDEIWKICELTVYELQLSTLKDYYKTEKKRLKSSIKEKKKEIEALVKKEC